jgi:hypothetical protein
MAACFVVAVRLAGAAGRHAHILVAWAGPDHGRLRLERLRLGRQLASLVRCHSSTASCGPNTSSRPGRSGEAWTAASLVVHCLASAGGEDAHSSVARSGRIRIDSNLAGSSPCGAPSRADLEAHIQVAWAGRSGEAWTAARLVVHCLASAAGRDAHILMIPVARLGRIRIDTDWTAACLVGVPSRECSRPGPAGVQIPVARSARSGEAWTAARLVVHRLTSAAGRGQHTSGSAGPI